MYEYIEINKENNLESEEKKITRFLSIFFIQMTELLRKYCKKEKVKKLCNTHAHRAEKGGKANENLGFFFFTFD